MDHALINCKSDSYRLDGRSAAALVRLGRPWRTDSKVDSGQANDVTGKVGARRSKSKGTEAPTAMRGRAGDPKNLRAVPVLELVLEWHERCDHSYDSSRDAVRPWEEKREWECSPLEWLRQRARTVVKQTLAARSYRGKKSCTEDVKLWQAQMATNFKDGNLDLNDLSDVSSLPTLLKLLAIEKQPDLTDEVLSTLTGMAKGAKSLPQDINDWCSLLEALLELVEPPVPPKAAVVSGSSEEAKLQKQQLQPEADSNLAIRDLDKLAVDESRRSSSTTTSSRSSTTTTTTSSSTSSSTSNSNSTR